MRSLVIGASGFVGETLYRQALPEAVGTYCSHAAPNLWPLDIRDAQAVARVLREAGCEVVFLPAAQPHVDWCEEHPQESAAVNVEGTHTVARVAAELGMRLVFFSTDYVFDGAAGPYREDAVPNPINEYGRQKRAAEEGVLAASEDHLVVRVCGVYGYEAAGKNFVMSFVRRARAGERLRVPSDQWGNPSYVEDVAAAVRALAAAGQRGVWHVAARDYLSRADFARCICREFGVPEEAFEAVSSEALQQRAPRPKRAGLDATRLRRELGVRLRGVGEGLREARERWEAAELSAAREAQPG